MGMQVVIMGVCGCGKSTVAQELSRALSATFIEGDAYHSSSNVTKMAGGSALTDDDRWPWLDRLGAALAASTPSIASCSALKRAYRDRLRGAVGPSLQFVMLDLSRTALLERMTARSGHYMPASLLDSQLATLERPQGDEADAIVIDGGKTLPDLIEELRARLGA